MENVLENHEQLEAVVDTFCKTTKIPDLNWVALEKLLGPALLGQFMFMNNDLYQGIMLYHYKHGMTRKYLILDKDLHTYHCLSDGKCYKCQLADALEHVFKDCEILGAIPGQNYDDEFRTKRDEGLRKAGYNVITGTVGKGVKV